MTRSGDCAPESYGSSSLPRRSCRWLNRCLPSNWYYRNQSVLRKAGAMAARNNAFTLLELMLATVLSVMLMVGVMGVVGQIRHSAAIGPSTSQSSALDEALDAWVRLLREDLNQTTQPVTSKSNELALIALGGLDAGRLERTHRPACIVYRLASIGGRSWLVRS